MIKFTKGQGRLRRLHARRWAVAMVGLAVTLCGGCGGVFWRPDLGGAMDLARRTNRIVVVAYWSDFDADCALMDQRVFTNREVIDTLKPTVTVKLSSMFNRSFAERYGLDDVPAFVILAADGSVLLVRKGYMDEARFRGMVEGAYLSR